MAGGAGPGPHRGHREFRSELQVDAHAYSTVQARHGGAKSRLCDCSGCWFITLARSRPILLIIIFVKLIISVSVSVTVPMNYIQITLINQQNGFRGKCFVHMDVLPFRECLMSSPFISVLTSIISHRRIVLRHALCLSLYPRRGPYLLSLKAKRSVYSGGGGLHMAEIEWYSIHTVLFILILSFISSPPSLLMLDWTAWYSPYETHTEGWDAETLFVSGDFPFWHLDLFIYFILIWF